MSITVDGRVRAKVNGWMEPKTPGGRWSYAQRYDEQSIVLDAEGVRKFFGVMFPRERREYSYTRAGYLPTHVTCPAPAGYCRRVYEVEYFYPDEPGYPELGE